MGRFLVAIALVMTLAQASGTLAFAAIDACSDPCPAESSDQGCPPSSDCCSCCATAPSTTFARPALPRRGAASMPLLSAPAGRPPLPAAADIFHVPLAIAA